MSYKQVEASREIRLWIGQIIVPAVTTVALVYLSNPNFKDFVDSKFDSVKSKFKSKGIKIIK